MKNAVRSLVLALILLAGIILMPVSSKAATIQLTGDGINITKTQEENYVLTLESSRAKLEVRSYQNELSWDELLSGSGIKRGDPVKLKLKAMARKIVAILRLERQSSLVQVVAVPATPDGPRQEKITGPITIQTEVWYMDGLSTRASGTILIPTTEARWPTEAGSRSMASGTALLIQGSCMQIHGFDLNQEASITTITSKPMGTWHMMNGLASFTSTVEVSGLEIYKSNL